VEAQRGPAEYLQGRVICRNLGRRLKAIDTVMYCWNWPHHLVYLSLVFAGVSAFSTPGQPCRRPLHTPRSWQLSARARLTPQLQATPFSFGELPDARVLDVIDGPRVRGRCATAADVASASGLPLETARGELVKLVALLADDAAAEVLVDNEGEVAFAFPRDVRGAVHKRSRAARWNLWWQRSQVYG